MPPRYLRRLPSKAEHVLLPRDPLKTFQVVLRCTYKVIKCDVELERRPGNRQKFQESCRNSSETSSWNEDLEIILKKSAETLEVGEKLPSMEEN